MEPPNCNWQTSGSVEESLNGPKGPLDDTARPMHCRSEAACQAV